MFPLCTDRRLLKFRSPYGVRSTEYSHPAPPPPEQRSVLWREVLYSVHVPNQEYSDRSPLILQAGEGVFCPSGIFDFFSWRIGQSISHRKWVYKERVFIQKRFIIFKLQELNLRRCIR